MWMIEIGVLWMGLVWNVVLALFFCGPCLCLVAGGEGTLGDRGITWTGDFFLELWIVLGLFGVWRMVKTIYTRSL